MFRRLVPFWVIASTIIAGGSARAQLPFPSDLVPSRSALERLGLERHWYGIVPLVEAERVIQLSLSDGLIFAQTNYAMLHTFDAQTGRLLWSSQLGARAGFARGAAANSFAVFVSSANIFYALERRSGRMIWRYDLQTMPTSPPACDEERVIVGMTSGLLIGFQLKIKDSEGKESLRTTGRELWRWHTPGPVLTRPLPAQQLLAFGGGGGLAYVVMADERTQLYRFNTGGPIGEGLASYGTRTLLIPSGDNVLYAVDLFTGAVSWSFASGAPIEHEPVVADEDIYVVNTAGSLSSLRPNDGVPRWTTSTQGGRVVSVGASKIFLRSYNLDLFVIDRATGRIVVDPGESHVRAGLNLRDYELSLVNRFDDRMYFASKSGMILCLRERAQQEPRLLRDPKAHPFGYVPPEGIKPTPPPVPAASPEAGAEPKAEQPAGAEEAAPAKEKERAEPPAKEKENAEAPAKEKKEAPAGEPKADSSN